MQRGHVGSEKLSREVPLLPNSPFVGRGHLTGSVDFRHCGLRGGGGENSFGRENLRSWGRMES